MRADLPDPQVDRGGASGGYHQLAGSTSVARPGRLYWRRLTRCPPRRAIAAPGGITHQASCICNLTGVMGLLAVGCWLTTDDSRRVVWLSRHLLTGLPTRLIHEPGLLGRARAGRG